ncbi:MAG: hypothetical protein U0U66_03790 [Cytophagaceae bacterium]
MKSTRIFISFISITLFISSCSKKESDYIGDYKTYIGHQVVVGNSFNAGSFYGQGPKDGFEAKDLNTIEISIFKDETTGNIGGQLFVTSPEILQGGFTRNMNLTKKKFSITSMHMNGDTLFVNTKSPFSASILELYLLKEGDKSFIGIENRLSSKVDKGPLIDKEGVKFDQYKANLEDINSYFQDYIYGQMVYLDSIAVKSNEPEEVKIRAFNAIQFYNKMYNKNK